ncbi:hypothetical protein ACFL11_00480 [Patescibacteria group bacterium]
MKNLILTIIILAAMLLICNNNRGSSKIDKKILDAASRACENVSGEAMTTYKDGPGPHPIVLFDSSGNGHQCLDDFPNEWLPESVSAVELVACPQKEGEIKIQTCRYTGSSLTRHRRTLELTLREANTSNVIATIILYGSYPPDCSPVKSSRFTASYGSQVSCDQLQEWLEEYVVPGE